LTLWETWVANLLLTVSLGGSDNNSLIPSIAAQFRDSLAILHDLVFGIRQGVEDLHYRLQDTDAKVELFLQTLSSMHEAFSSSPAETDSNGGASAATGEGQDKAQRSAEREREKDGRESNADETAGDVKVGKLWADQTTYVEEEPWTEDLHATWPDYLTRCLVL
jgi:hypothetical protein